MQRTADLLREFTSGKMFANCEDDAILRSTVERLFEIIGEANKTNLAGIDRPTASRISHYQRIVAFRNTLIPRIHGRG